MEPMTAVATGIGIVKSIVELTKKITNSVNRRDNPELLDAVYEMKEKALDLQEAIMNLRTENEELRNEIKRLNDISDLDNKFERYEGKTYYTLPNDDGTKRYICSACWDSNLKTITMRDLKSGYLVCPVCGNSPAV